MDRIHAFEKELIVARPAFRVGDTVKVHYKILEGGKERVQVYEGLVISIANKGLTKSFTVRRISYDVGVERIFPISSPKIADIEVTRRGHVRRAKLFYLRDKIGKKARTVREAKRPQRAGDTKASGSKAGAAKKKK